MTEFQRLEKTCYFGNYIESVIRDQFLCALRDMKTYQELLCIPHLTAQTALHKAYAVKAIYKETHTIKDSSCKEVTFNIRPAQTCYGCGSADHVAASCKYKTAQCNECQKIGHQVRVCKVKTKSKLVMRGQSKANATKGKDHVYLLETIDTEVPNNVSESDHLYAILQLGNKAEKFLVSTKINGSELKWSLILELNGLLYFGHCTKRN